MKTRNIRVPLRDGELGAYLAIPDRVPAGAVIAIMEIWGVNDLLERRLAPNPLVTIYKYPDADHAFARHGGKPYRKADADRALALTLDFFRRMRH